MIRIICLALASCTLMAADPILVVSVPDMARTRERFATSPYGLAWNEPDAGALRNQLQGLSAMLQFQLGIDPLQALAQVEGIELEVFDLPVGGGEPPFRAQIRGAAAAELIQRALAQTPSPRVVSRMAEDRLLLASAEDLLEPLGVVESPTDLVYSFDPRSLLDQIPGPGAMGGQAPMVSLMQQLMASYSLPQTSTLSLTERGIRVVQQVEGRYPGTVAIDRQALQQLPADAWSVTALGLDGSELWDAVVVPMLDDIAELEGLPRAEIEQRFDQQMAQSGLTRGLAGTLAGLQGTASLTFHGSGPLPAISLELPACPAVDDLLAMAGTRFQQPLPAVGDFEFLVLQGLSLNRPALGLGSVALGRTADSWIISSDPLYISQRLAGGETSWWESDLGRQVLAEAADATPLAVMVGDSQSQLRSLLPVLAAFGNGLGSPDAMRGLSHLLHRFVTASGTDLNLVLADGQGMRVVQDGPTGGLANLPVLWLAIGSAIAVPNLMESRVTANESAAQATLKSAVFAGQVQFQAGAYNDLDGDNRGEYGFLMQLGGGVPPFATGGDAQTLPGGFDPKGLTLLGREMAEAPMMPVSGYHFQVWLPDGAGGAVDLATMQARVAKGELPEAMINDQEKYFVAYAWPAEPGRSGNRVFVLTQEGRVHQASASQVSLPPAWNAAFGGVAGKPAKETFRAVQWPVIEARNRPQTRTEPLPEEAPW